MSSTIFRGGREINMYDTRRMGFLLGLLRSIARRRMGNASIALRRTNHGMMDVVYRYEMYLN